MRIVVSDTSCLIDLRKVSLLDVLLRLPYEFLIPNTLFVLEIIESRAQTAVLEVRRASNGPARRSWT